MAGFRVAAALCALGCLAFPARPQAQTAYSTAMAQVQAGRSDLAIPLLEKLLAAAPGDLKARNLLGIALLNSGRKQEAAVQFRKAVTADPKFRPALKNLAITEMETGSPKAAKLHFEEVLRLSPNDPVVHLYLGNIYFDEKRYAEAAAHFAAGGETVEKDARTAIRYAQSLIESGKASAAETVLDRLPQNATSREHFEAGTLLAGAKNYAAASRQFLADRENYPDAYTLGFNMTLVYLEGGDPAAAIRTGTELLNRGPAKAELYNLLSRAYEAAGQTQQAYDALRAATRLEPANESNYIDLMSLCLQHENWDLSLEISDIAAERIPNSYRLPLLRGAVFAMKGRLDDAADAFLVSSRRAPPDQDLPSVALALARIEQNRVEDAITVLRARRARGSKDYRVYWFLGSAISRLGAEPGTAAEREAVAALETAIRMKPDLPEARVLLGKFLVQRGQPDRAAAHFEAALAADPNEMGAAYQLALIYRDQGKTQQAEELAAKVAKSRAAPEPPSSQTLPSLVKIVREGSR